MTLYRCCDEGGQDIDIEANSPEEAAQEYVDGGNYEPKSETSWVNVVVHELDGDGEIIDDTCHREKIAIEPEEPECSSEDGHNWKSPIEVVGGIKENPGVWGHGGGVTIHEVCSHCGLHRHTDTWSQDMSDGVQGLRSTKYEDADDESLEWIDGDED